MKSTMEARFAVTTYRAELSADATARKALILAAARSTSLPAYAAEKFARDARKQTAVRS